MAKVNNSKRETFESEADFKLTSKEQDPKAKKQREKLESKAKLELMEQVNRYRRATKAVLDRWRKKKAKRES